MLGIPVIEDRKLYNITFEVSQRMSTWYR